MMQKLKKLLKDIKSKYKSLYFHRYFEYSKDNVWFGYNKISSGDFTILTLVILKIRFMLEIGPISCLDIGIEYIEDEDDYLTNWEFSKYDGLYYSHISDQFLEIEDHGEKVAVQYENGFFGIVNFEHINKSAVNRHLKDKTWEKVIGLSND